MTATYTPILNDTAAILAAADSALNALVKVVEKAETTAWVPLALCFADYCAIRFQATGAHVGEKEVKEFFAGVVKKHETSKKTIATYATLARKAGMLTSRSQSSFRPAWVRLVDGSLHVEYAAKKPGGDHWVRDIVHDVSVTRPSEKKGKGEKTYYVPRASAILPATRGDIEDAYRFLILGDARNQDGTIINKPKGADTSSNKDGGKSVSVTFGPDCTPVDLVKAFYGLLHDKNMLTEVEHSAEAVEMMAVIFNRLDAHITSEGDFVAAGITTEENERKLAA